MNKASSDRGRRVELRRQSQFHRGGEVSKRHPGMTMDVHSKRNGKVVRDLNHAVDQLTVVLKRVENRVKTDATRMIVGTTPELGRRRELRCEGVDSTKRVRVTRTWISGMLTNYTSFQKDMRRLKETNEERKTYAEKRWYESHRKGREGMVVKRSSDGKRVRSTGRPGLVRFRHPNDHGVGRKEARRCGVPTVGVADSDCKYRDRLTYPIPGNDESRVAQMTLVMRVMKVLSGVSDGRVMKDA
jgi:ribosomal protein S2